MEKLINNRNFIFLENMPDDKGSAFVKEHMQNLRSWNPRPGEIHTVTYKGEHFYRARIKELNDFNCEFICFEEIKNPEPEIFISLFQAVPEKERMELIIEKAVELGVSKIVPVVTEKSISVEKRDEKQKKSQNWPKIALRAAKQCRRAIIPEVSQEIILSGERRDNFRLYDLAFFLDEKEDEISIKDFIKHKKIKSIGVFTGPEGGFSKRERIFFRDNGIKPVTLGPRILRTETAAVSVLSVLSYEFELPC